MLGAWMLPSACALLVSVLCVHWGVEAHRGGRRRKGGRRARQKYRGRMAGKLKKEANLSGEKAAMLYFHLANCRGALGTRARTGVRLCT